MVRTHIVPILNKIKDDDLVFVENENFKNTAINEMNFFKRVRQRANLDHLIYPSGTHI